MTGGPLGSECEVRDALRLEYLRRARTYSEAVAQLSELTKEPIENKFFIQLGVTEKARTASGKALLAYDRHRNEHGCMIRVARLIPTHTGSASPDTKSV
jgi:hypothetical protein